MANRYKVELGRTIAERRRELGLTQKELAELTHYKEGQTVSRWERGENLPTDLEVVATALQWTLPELMAGITPPDRRTARRLGVIDGTPTPFPGADVDAQLATLTRMVSELAAQLQDLRGETAATAAEVLQLLDDRLPPSAKSQRRRPA